MKLELMSREFCVCRLDADAVVPQWALQGDFFSVTRTPKSDLDPGQPGELSIVCSQANAPAEVRAERGWRCLRVQGTLDFGLTGILASLASPLAEAGISVFAVSTFDTDYLLVKSDTLERTLQVLSKAGHKILTS